MSTSTTSSVNLSHKNAAFAEEEQKAFLRGSPAGSSGKTRKQKMIPGSWVKNTLVCESEDNEEEEDEEE